MKKKAVAPAKKERGTLEPLTTQQLYLELAAGLDLSPADVKALFKKFAAVAEDHLFSENGSREFVIPELGVKLRVVLRPELPEREGRNPATGKKMMLKPRPASWKGGVRFLKPFKEALKLMTPPPSSKKSKK